MAAHDGAMVSEEEMWPSPFSKDAAHWPNGGFKLEVPKKLTRGEKKRLNKASREKVLKDEVMNVVWLMQMIMYLRWKNDVFRPFHSGPSPSKSPPSSDKKEPEPEEKTKSKEKSKSERKKQRLMIKSDQYFFITINNSKIISD